MRSALYEKARQAFLDGDISWSGDTIKAALIDLNDIGVAITGATNATPIVVTANSHGFSNGDIVLITGVAGNTAANGVFRIANQATNTFELQTVDGTNVAGSGSYTSGGIVVNMTTPDNFDDITAGDIAISSALSSKTVTNGVADAADVTFSAVTGDQFEAVLLFKDSGTPSTSPLIALIAEVTGLPATPSGGDITIAWGNGTNKIFRL